MNIVPAKASAPAPKMVVTSGLTFWRTSELSDSFGVSQQLAAAKEQVQDDVIISGSFFQESPKSKLFHVASAAAKIAAPALAAGGLLAAGVSNSLVLGGLGLATLLTTIVQAPKISKGIKDYKEAREHQGSVQGLDVWRGGPPVELKDLSRSSPSEKGLQAMLTANMRDFPSALHVFHANGHGMGAKYAAGLPGAKLAEAVNNATAQAQNEVDVAIMDTCFGSNFEQLARFGDGVQYVVAFEDAIPNAHHKGGRIPLDTMLAGAAQMTDGRQAALAIAQKAGEFFQTGPVSSLPVSQRLADHNYDKLRSGTDSTVAAISMKALKQQLHPALDKAGAELMKASQGNDALREAIHRAKRAAEIHPGGDLIDLGNFLAEVHKASPADSAVNATLKEALDALKSTLLSTRTGETHKLSGLSVHTRNRPGGGGQITPDGSYPMQGDHLPQAWVKFVQTTFRV